MKGAARVASILAGALGFAAACGGDDPVRPVDLCDARPLPFASSAGAPVVTDVAVEVQAEGLVLLLTATSELGADGFDDIAQRAGIYRFEGCEGVPFFALDDLACSGCEESFGTVVAAAAHPELYADVAAASAWPVEVVVTDRVGRRTEGTVAARVVR